MYSTTALKLYFVFYQVYLSNCIVQYHFIMWLGRESSWLTCLPHFPTRCHAHMSLLINACTSLHCLGYTVRILRQLRYPMVQHHCTPPTTEDLPRLLQSTPYGIMIWLSLRTLASYLVPGTSLRDTCPHYPRCTCFIHRICFPAVHLHPQASR